MPDPASTRETKRDQLIEAAHAMLHTDGVMRELGKLCLAMLDPPEDVRAAMERLRKVKDIGRIIDDAAACENYESVDIHAILRRIYPQGEARNLIQADREILADYILAQTGDAT